MIAAERAEHDRRMMEWADSNSSELPPHDPDATCPKCGADARRIATVYHRTSQQPSNLWGWVPYKECPSGKLQLLGEHLCRICGRCDYGWPEATVG